MALSTPILFCVFNRPELTERVFAAIRAQRPRQLLVVQDGPRLDRWDDLEAVERVRQVVTAVDWPCDLQTRFAATNLGCKQRMASGISWGFQRCERLIILEDDCLPSPDFFEFCEAMLDRFADDPRVLMISGDNFQPAGSSRSPYYFSKYAHIWGWASWRRAWDWYEVELSDWPQFRDSDRFCEVCPDPGERAYWRQQLDLQWAGQIDSWDFPWMFAGWLHRAWTVLPAENLVTNLGFGPGATHTTSAESPLANLPLGRFDAQSLLALAETEAPAPDRAADQWTWQHVFRPPMPAPSPSRRRSHWRNWWRVFPSRSLKTP